MDPAADADHMRAALDLAALGPAPDANPRVGALVLDASGAVAGRGSHRGAGTAHAEVLALAQAGPRARGGTAYVTLEPCAHAGRTGPCATALIEAGITRVVYGQADPNPVAAGGERLLRNAEVEVQAGLLADQATRLNLDWTFSVTHGRPRVTWKYAATLDGYSAAADGSSQWITSRQSRADVHRHRARCGAVLVGTGTVLADDPQLTVRDDSGASDGRQPLRVVAGLRDLPADARVCDAAAATLHLRERDPHRILAALADRQVHHVWLEGGPTLAAAFLRAGLVDEVLGYLAPALLGSGRPAIADLGVTTIDGIRRLHLVQVRRIGPDLRLRCVPDTEVSDAEVRGTATDIPGSGPQRQAGPNGLPRREAN